MLITKINPCYMHTIISSIYFDYENTLIKLLTCIIKGAFMICTIVCMGEHTKAADSETYVSSQLQPLAVWGCSSPDGARYVILLPQTWGVFNSDTPTCFWLTLRTNKRKEKGFHFRLVKIHKSYLQCIIVKYVLTFYFTFFIHQPSQDFTETYFLIHISRKRKITVKKAISYNNIIYSKNILIHIYFLFW